MTYSETKFRNLLDKRYKGALIVKFPDFKAGAILSSGYPDYLVIHDGNHLWFEVKTTPSKYTFNFNLIEDSQWRVFKMMLNNDIDVNLAVYTSDWTLHMLKFSDILKLQTAEICVLTLQKR